jgi:ABC-2 type transport system ATP-binding protein
MLDFVGMGQERYRPVDTYSTGMKQRVKLAQAIVHDPELVFLDEPTNGLDPRGREQILQLVESLWRDHQISVELSSHLLQDVDRICGEIIIIARGEVLVQDTLKNLKGRRAGFAELVVEGEHQRVLEVLRANDCTCELESNGHITVQHGRESLTPVLKFLRDERSAPHRGATQPQCLGGSFPPGPLDSWS